MSVSSTRVRTWTRLRSAILSSTVPPPTSLVGEEMTWPRSTCFSMMVPLIGARTLVSSSWSLRVVERHPGPDDLGIGVGIVEQGLLVFLLGNRLRLEQLVGPALLGAGVGEAGLRHLEVGLGLRHGVPWNARIHPDHQIAPLDRLPGLHGKIEDFARGLGFHFDGGVWLDRAGGLGGHDDVAAYDGKGLIGRRRRFLLAGCHKYQPNDCRPEQREGAGARLRSLRSAQVTALFRSLAPGRLEVPLYFPVLQMHLPPRVLRDVVLVGNEDDRLPADV